MPNIDIRAFTPDVISEINNIIKRGNTAELKYECGKLVIVEIERRVRNKTAITG